MLRERTQLEQLPGEMRRRWFFSEYFDLIVWYLADSDGDAPAAGAQVAAFDLHYDKSRDERVFMWRRGRRLRHHAVDDGTRGGRVKMTPVVTAAVLGADAAGVAERFARESHGLDPTLVACVLDQLRGLDASSGRGG